jgi:hypothetical protein
LASVWSVNLDPIRNPRTRTIDSHLYPEQEGQSGPLSCLKIRIFSVEGWRLLLELGNLHRNLTKYIYRAFRTSGTVCSNIFLSQKIIFKYQILYYFCHKILGLDSDLEPGRYSMTPDRNTRTGTQCCGSGSGIRDPVPF